MKTGFAGVFLIFIAIAAVFSGCDKKEEKKETVAGPVLAEVNDKVITPDDFQLSLQILYNPSERPRYMTPEGRNNFLQLLTIMELFYQEGQRRGLDEDPYIQKSVENYRRYLIYHTLITRDITPESMKAHFQENFFHVALIRIAKPKDGSEKSAALLKAKAEKLLGQLADGADFEKYARKYSDHASAANGGDLGPTTFTNEWPVEVLRAMAALREEGQLSPVVEAADGFYILKLIEPYGKMDYSGMTDRIQEIIFNSMVRENIKTYSAQLRLMSKVKTFPENLELLDNEASDKARNIVAPTVAPLGVPAIDTSGQ